MTTNDTIDDVDFAAPLRSAGVRIPLSDAYRARLEKQCARPSRLNEMWEFMISPHLVLEELDQHVPIHEEKSSNFSDQCSRRAARLLNSGELAQVILSLFSNPLRRPAFGPGFPMGDHRWHHKWELPLDRAVIGPFWIFTYEWDSDLPDALQTQFDWVWNKGPDGVTAVERLDRHLRKSFKDYRGYTAVWSGGKSVHIHLVFDPSHMCRATISGLAKIKGRSPEAKIRDHWRGDIRPDAIWDYYRIKWWEIHGLFHDVAGVLVEFDTNLQTLFQKRRLPWGVRVAEADDPNGFQEGDLIPQVVLAERLQRTSPKLSNAYFLTAEEANQLPVKGPIRGRRDGSSIELDDDGMLDVLRTYLRKHWGKEYPKPARLSEIEGQVYLHFFNHSEDQRPASYVREDYSRIVFLGKGAPTDDETVRSLPGGVCLHDLLLNLLEEDEARGQMIEADSPSSNRATFRHPAHKLFARRAGRKTLSGIRAGMAVGSWLLSTACPRLVIVSTEGAGKSTALIRQALSFQLEDHIENYFGGQNLNAPNNGFHIVASLSYKQAEEQYQRYTDWCRTEDVPVNAVLLKSFAEYYSEYFEQNVAPNDVEPISWVDSLDMGYNTQIDAVYHEQPDIYDAITKLKNEAWRLPGTSPNKFQSGFQCKMDALIFTSHKLAQGFNEVSKTKAWMHPDFDPDMEPDKWRQLATCFRAYRIIHDEISLADLLHIASEKQVELAAAFKALVERKGEKSWKDLPMTVKRQVFMDQASDGLKEIGFYDTISIIDANFQTEHRVVVDFERLPFGRDNTDEGLYKGKTGSAIYLKEKSWWLDTRARIAVTTTESLVAEVASQLRDADGRKVFHVERWDSEQYASSDVLELILDTRACRKRIQELAEDVLADLTDPTEVIITDMAEGENIYTHLSARGRNDLDDKNITTVLTFIGGDEYAKLNAVAQSYGIGNLIELFYRDRLNQAAGRNRGLRSQMPEPLKHKLRISPTLMQVLGGHGFFGKGRYSACLVAA
jgi:hypothetical protein